ncbi:BET1 homolog [Anopheles albimanus]|uniref:BET1 homolog n=2 Tax=Nyssorhynchus TaxID=44543 RepID=A0A2M4C3T8_9DIPT|nr:BET1 homolog [Anopheles albimanus]
MRRSQGYNYQPLPQHQPGPSSGQQASGDALEEENERMAEELKGKIGALKSLTIDIGNEVRYQDRLLRGMDEDMDRTGGFMSNTINRVVRLGKGGHRNYMCYMFLFVLAVFFLLYIVLKLR